MLVFLKNICELCFSPGTLVLDRVSVMSPLSSFCESDSLGEEYSS